MLTVLREIVNYTEVCAIAEVPNKDDHIYYQGQEYIVVAVLRDYDANRTTAFVRRLSKYGSDTEYKSKTNI